MKSQSTVLNQDRSGRYTFARIPTVVEFPDLLNVQLESFEHFLQERVPAGKRKNKGLQQVFLMNFPITDARENYLLEFVEYYVEKPKYSMRECQERGLTFAVPLKAKLRLSTKAEDGKAFADTIEEVVYLGNLPYMTERGTFIINGAERVIVSQLHRSPGVFFGESVHPNGTPIFSARIIPFRGSWVEFTTDINNVMYAYIDRKKKFPVTTLLRALGYSSDDEILELFELVEEVKVADVDLKEYTNRIICGDVVDRKTGEIIINKDAVLSEEAIKRIKKSEVKKLRLLKSEAATTSSVIANTIQKDSVHSEEDALEAIYRQLRSGDAPDLDTAKNLIDKLFFNPKRYDLGDVGRHRLNAKLKLEIPVTTTTLTKEDIIAIIRYLIELQQGKTSVDDIDHLGNRRVRTVGEQIGAQFNIGLSRMCRTIRERMNIRDQEQFSPADLVNARTITSVINAFFGTNQLSQYMDQTNPLAELTNKRRMSALGPGGLTRERAGFEVRDVHYTHYGRLCPIETPEGPNIGLISSLCMHARVNEFGFIETPYRNVKKGKVSDEEVTYLNAEQEDEFLIAQANVPLDDRGRFETDRVSSRKKGDFVVHQPEDIEYMDVAPTQIVSAAAALIPFLEHDDANRALMGSNMQRQSVPLLRPHAPIVGTGLEEKVARDSRTCVLAERSGVVENVSGNRIIVIYDIEETSTEALLSFEDKRRVEYQLTKFFRTNQDTCINQKPVVVPGQRFKRGDVLADGCATDHGELALGRNVLVAFMPWRGYNFEDAIIINERIVSEDVYTSIHIEEFELQVRDTKRGEEELTREIPNVSEEATKDLDENGIIRVGAEVKEGDILIGKITPKGETDPTPEEKLLKAIFGEKAGDVKDASLKAPPGMKGIVIETKLFSRKKKDAETKKEDKKRLDQIEKQRKKDIADHFEKLGRKLDLLLDGEKSAGVRDSDGAIVFRAGTQFREGSFSKYEQLEKLEYEKEWVDDKRKNNLVTKIFENYFESLNHIEEAYKHEKNKITLGDELPPGIVQLAKVYVAKKRKLSVGDKMAGRHGNKGVVAAIVPREDMPFMPDGTPVDIVLNPLGVPSRMNLGQLFETALGWAGKALGVKFSTPIFDGASWEEIQEQLKKASLHQESRSVLLDGRTGERFDQEVTVGYIYIMKLSHLVDDKIHARSIGPYSLITQQPLGGKAQFGGQRFGEMEVWALQGYGAAHVLQEILTVKSDDVVGRAKVYEAIVKGDNLPESNVPESFNVLVRELQGLGLEVKIE
ncbi:MAG: DNA-directed RNA polymerase subunit beta [Ignavibacteriales bacterium]|nr:DNA-directed RNA polymerase subunit beta [Ignavibacteriales bacterium]